MRERRRTTALVLAGAVALAGTGFAIGSQAGGGSAEAARAGDRSADGRGFGRHGGPGLGSLAQELGVSEERLREALDAVRPSHDRDDKHAELAAALATSLGVDEAKVTEALEGLQDARHDAFADELAQALGIEASKARSVLDSLRPDRSADRSGDRPRRPSLATLARRLGVTQAELRAALREAGPPRHGRGNHGPGGRHGDLAADLARALGVEAAKVEDALEAFHDAKRDAFAQTLADELGIDVDRVRDALPPKRP